MKKAIFKSSNKIDESKLKLNKEEQMKLINLFNQGEIEEDFIENIIRISSESFLSYSFIDECINNDIGINYLSHLDLQDDLLIKIKNKNKFIEVEQTLLYRYYSIDYKTSYYSREKIDDKMFEKIIKNFNLSRETIEWGLEHLKPISKSRYDFLNSLIK